MNSHGEEMSCVLGKWEGGVCVCEKQEAPDGTQQAIFMASWLKYSKENWTSETGYSDGQTGYRDG